MQKSVEEAGGNCLPVQMDLRYEDQVENAIKKTIDKFGSLDILINNASAINLTGTLATEMKRYDLMHSINTRGTFLASKLAIPHLKNSSNPHILNLSPPLIMNPKWFKDHVAYTMAKYGMSMCVLGMAEELKDLNIKVNALWPLTSIWTAAMNMLSPDSMKTSRTASILADAAYVIFSKESSDFTGKFLIDEELLKEEGVTNFDAYAIDPTQELTLDFFLPDRFYEGRSKLFNLDAKASPPGGSVDRLFKKFETLVTDQIKNELNALLEFQISGKSWFMNAKSDEPLKISTDSLGEPTVSLITDEDTFIKMLNGKTPSASAYMQGKLKIKGNLQVALKLEKLFKKARQDL